MGAAVNAPAGAGDPLYTAPQFMRSHADTARARQPGAVLEPGPPEGNVAVLRLSGRLDIHSVAPLWQYALAALAGRPSLPVTIDAAGVAYCDGAGVALLVNLLRQQRRAGAEVNLRNLPEQCARLLQQFEPRHFGPSRAPVAESVGLTEEIGHAAADFLRQVYERIAFVGESVAAMAATAAHPLRLRWNDILLVFRRVGADAVPIVVLIGFLMGVILAFQSAIAMRQFGAEIYVANLVALSMLRELGPLMTAIILAGRSGSAFAAEIGTMKVNEEIDALVTMGLDPVRFLVVPRLLAGFLLCPLLTLMADLVGLLGGAFVMSSFGVPLVTYFQQVESAATHGDLIGGVAKAFAFGLLVAGVGCLQGLRTGQGPSAVGVSTTRAVVGGIVLIVAADGVFAVLFHVLQI
jgi:phospholipid/cholesterol/gamma-HCH transport system permease protein